MNMASIANQQHFTKLVARWTSCCRRPFSICEDTELQAVIDFVSQVKGKLILPTRNTNKIKIVDEASGIKAKMTTFLANKCSDMWSLRTRNSFMAFTIHLPCADFCMYNYTLAVKPTIGNHTAKMIQGYMGEIMNE